METVAIRSSLSLSPQQNFPLSLSPAKGRSTVMQGTSQFIRTLVGSILAHFTRQSTFLIYPLPFPRRVRHLQCSRPPSVDLQ